MCQVSDTDRVQKCLERMDFSVKHLISNLILGSYLILALRDSPFNLDSEMKRSLAKFITSTQCCSWLNLKINLIISLETGGDQYQFPIPNLWNNRESLLTNKRWSKQCNIFGLFIWNLLSKLHCILKRITQTWKP